MGNSPVTTELYQRLQKEVHVWFCQPLLIDDRAKLSEYKSVLSEQEIEHYHRFHFEKDKHSYLVSHVLLRHVLSMYADVHAAQWQFSSNEHGKPELISSVTPDLCFNLTHTEGLCACVISLNRSCGIDVERTGRKDRLAAVAQRMFAEEELAVLNTDNIKQQFYYYWTLREAYVKAMGTGLAGSSKQFYFSIDKNDSSVEIQHNDSTQFVTENWHFSLHEPTREHVLAVGFESADDARVVVAEIIP